MKQIKLVTVDLESPKWTILHCQNALDLLVTDVLSGFDEIGSLFYRCFLKNLNILSSSTVLQDSLHESGVRKIQNGRTAAMIEGDRSAFQRLLLAFDSSEDEMLEQTKSYKNTRSVYIAESVAK